MNKQEALWAGEFGDVYLERIQGHVPKNIALFARALQRASDDINNCIEFGAGTGMALQALKALYPHQEQYAIEFNPKAVERLASVIPQENIHSGRILDYKPKRTFDLVFTKVALVTITPDDLPATYEVMHAATGRYLLLCEYYNPTPVEIPYRGDCRLWKRDFAGEMLDAFPDLKLIDYGFFYRRDAHRLDDYTWFLMERRRGTA